MVSWTIGHPALQIGYPEMFVSFFPRPKLFFWSALIWIAVSMAFWYGYAEGLVAPSKTIGVSLFWSTPSFWFHLYFVVSVAIFCQFLDGVFTTPLGKLVHSWFGADPVHFVLSGPGQCRHQQLVRAILRSFASCPFKVGSG